MIKLIVKMTLGYIVIVCILVETLFAGELFSVSMKGGIIPKKRAVLAYFLKITNASLYSVPRLHYSWGFDIDNHISSNFTIAAGTIMFSSCAFEDFLRDFLIIEKQTDDKDLPIDVEMVMETSTFVTYKDKKYRLTKEDFILTPYKEREIKIIKKEEGYRPWGTLCNVSVRDFPLRENERIIAFVMQIHGAFYSLPDTPTGWFFDILNSENSNSIIYANTNNDEKSLGLDYFKNFVIIDDQEEDKTLQPCHELLKLTLITTIKGRKGNRYYVLNGPSLEEKVFFPERYHEPLLDEIKNAKDKRIIDNHIVLTRFKEAVKGKNAKD